MRGNPARHPRGLRAFLHGLACALPLLVASPALAVGVGDAAPTFSARSLDGQSTLSLAAYRGKVVYLDFWASWCAPCLTSLPLLEKLRKEFPGDRFQILAVNVDREPDKARSFLARHPIGYPSASDPEGRLPATFGIETMPTSFLIDERGVVRLVHPGFRASDIDSIREHVRTLLEKSR